MEKRLLVANEKTEMILNIWTNQISCLCILQEQFRHPYIWRYVFKTNSPDGLDKQPDYVLALTAASGSEGGQETNANPTENPPN